MIPVQSSKEGFKHFEISLKRESHTFSTYLSLIHYDQYPELQEPAHKILNENEIKI